MRLLLVYAGANGAGKSSLRAGGTDPVEVVIDPDAIAREIAPTDPRSADFAAGKEALRRFDQAIAAGLSLSLETTLTGRTVLGRMRAARDAGFAVVLQYVGLRDADENVARVEARAARGGHWIEPDVVRRRVAASLENLPAAVALSDAAVLLDNTGPRHRSVLQIAAGRIQHQGDDLPPWLAGQLPRIQAELQRAAKASQPDPAAPRKPRDPGPRATGSG